MRTVTYHLYPSPLSRGYWAEAGRSLRELRCMLFAALMIAGCIVLARFKIPIGENLSVSITFLCRALCALVYGPLGGMVFGAAEDTLSFFLSSGGYPYFPGYALTTMLGCLIYALCFYRARITIRRIILAKVLTNIQNVFLGSLWSAMLYSKGYLYYMTTSAVKNIFYLPVQILLLVIVFQKLLPLLQRQHLIPCQMEGDQIPW